MDNTRSVCWGGKVQIHAQVQETRRSLSRSPLLFATHLQPCTTRNAMSHTTIPPKCTTPHFFCLSQYRPNQYLNA